MPALVRLLKSSKIQVGGTIEPYDMITGAMSPGCASSKLSRFGGFGTVFVDRAGLAEQAKQAHFPLLSLQQTWTLPGPASGQAFRSKGRLPKLANLDAELAFSIPPGCWNPEDRALVHQVR